MLNTKRRRVTAVLLVLLALLVGMSFAAGCSTGSDDKDDGKSAEEREKDATDRGMSRMTASQQVPEFDFSQERQTLIEALTIRAQGTHGTAQVYNLDGSMRWWCPTIGAPVPSTYQLTNPFQTEWRSGSGGDDASATTARAEPTGVYSGDSQATWIVCTDDAGTAFGKYAESDVEWTSGVVADLPDDKRVRVDEISYQFGTETAEGGEAGG